MLSNTIVCPINDMSSCVLCYSSSVALSVIPYMDSKIVNATTYCRSLIVVQRTLGLLLMKTIKTDHRISVPFVLRVIPGDELFNMCMDGVVCKYARLIVVMLDSWRR